MTDHIKYIRNSTSKQIATLKNELKHKRRESKISNGSKEAAKVTQIREETVLLHGELRKIKRIFVRAADSGNDYCKVGWVLTIDVDCCMVCMVQLRSFGLKHHCRACGNIVCQKCSSNDAVVEEIHEAGPVRVCSQCYWGQARVSAFHNDTLGLQVMNDEVIAVAIAPQHHITTINLRTYGKLVMCDIVPAFAIKARRRDRSVVYVNICSCKEVPLNVATTAAEGAEESALDGPKADVIFMVGGLRVDLEEDQQRDSESSRTPHNTPGNSSVSGAKAVAQDSVYDVAVNPAVVEDAERDGSGALKAKICDQVLKFIADRYIEDTFSVYQYVGGTDQHAVYVRGQSGSRSVSAERPSEESKRDGATKRPSYAEVVSVHRPSDLGLLNPATMASQSTSTSTVLPQLAVPSHLAFKRLGQIASNPAEIADKPPTAESEAEFDDYGSSPCAQGGEHMSMVHHLKNKMRQSMSPDSVDHAPNSDSESVGSPRLYTVSDRPADALHHNLTANTKSLTLIALPGFVIKTKRVGAVVSPSGDSHSVGSQSHSLHFVPHLPHMPHLHQQRPSLTDVNMKIFINVMHHSAVDDLLSSQEVALRESEKPLIIMGDITFTKDSRLEVSLLYNVAVGSEYFKQRYAKGEPKITDDVYIRKIIRAVNSKYNDTLNEDGYSLPHVKKGHKGESIELMTYTFNTAASDPVVALVHDINANNAMRQRAGQEREQRRKTLGTPLVTVAEVDSRKEDDAHSVEAVPAVAPATTTVYGSSRRGSANKGGESDISDLENDEVSQVSEATHDWQEVHHYHDHHSARTSDDPLDKNHKRRSLRHSIFGAAPPASNEGRALITSDDMFVYLKRLSLQQNEAVLLKKRSIEEAGVLLGWQIVFPKRNQDHSTLPVHVVTGIRKDALRKTEYRVSSKGADDFWVKLKRSDAKAGTVFWPLRKVLFLEEAPKVEKSRRKSIF